MKTKTPKKRRGATSSGRVSFPVFMGIYTTSRHKKAAGREARKRGLSLSAFVRTAINNELSR